MQAKEMGCGAFPPCYLLGTGALYAMLKGLASVKALSPYASKSASLTFGLLVVMTVCSCEYSGFTLTFFAFVFFYFLSCGLSLSIYL